MLLELQCNALVRLCVVCVGMEMCVPVTKEFKGQILEDNGILKLLDYSSYQRDGHCFH